MEEAFEVMYLPSFAVQTQYFLYSILLGIIIGITYDFLRMFREFIYCKRKPKFYVSDVLIFVIAAFLFELYTITFGYGKIRYYALLGAFVGFVFYLNTIGVISFKIEKKAAELLRKILLFFIVKPFLLLYNICIKLILGRRKGDGSGETEDTEETSEE